MDCSCTSVQCQAQMTPPPTAPPPDDAHWPMAGLRIVMLIGLGLQIPCALVMFWWAGQGEGQGGGAGAGGGRGPEGRPRREGHASPAAFELPWMPLVAAGDATIVYN